MCSLIFKFLVTIARALLYKFFGWGEDNLFHPSACWFLYIWGFSDLWFLGYILHNEEHSRSQIIILSTVADGSLFALLSNETKQKIKKLVIYNEIKHDWWTLCCYLWYLMLMRKVNMSFIISYFKNISYFSNSDQITYSVSLTNYYYGGISAKAKTETTCR